MCNKRNIWGDWGMRKEFFDSKRRFINKWDMYRLLSGRAVKSCRIPETRCCTPKVLHNFLNRFGSVYVKPIAGWGGERISRLEKEGSLWRWSRQGESQQMLKDWKSIEEFFLPLHPSDKYIVQQTAPLLTFEERPFNIRVHMQRTMDDSWIYAGELVRIGGPGSIVSNTQISDGTVVPLSRIVSHFETDASSFFKTLQEVGEQICRLLDTIYPFNEVGIDLGLGQKKELWLIEVNTDDAQGGPSHELFAQLPDLTVYEQIRRRYASRVGVPHWLQDYLFGEEKRGN